LYHKDSIEEKEEEKLYAFAVADEDEILSILQTGSFTLKNEEKKQQQEERDNCKYSFLVLFRNPMEALAYYEGNCPMEMMEEDTLGQQQEEKKETSDLRTLNFLMCCVSVNKSHHQIHPLTLSSRPQTLQELHAVGQETLRKKINHYKPLGLETTSSRNTQKTNIVHLKYTLSNVQEDQPIEKQAEIYLIPFHQSTTDTKCLVVPQFWILSIYHKAIQSLQQIESEIEVKKKEIEEIDQKIQSITQNQNQNLQTPEQVLFCFYRTIQEEIDLYHQRLYHEMDPETTLYLTKLQEDLFESQKHLQDMTLQIDQEKKKQVIYM
jgi:hypothetical protein